MKDLIEALTIFAKYCNPEWPTHCEHDIMYIMYEGKVSGKDAKRLIELGFNYHGRQDGEDPGWISFKFGRA